MRNNLRFASVTIDLFSPAINMASLHKVPKVLNSCILGSTAHDPTTLAQ